MTSLRVGIDFELAGTDKVPLDQKELRERIGADAVMDDPGLMQQRLAAAVYGIEDIRRYEDLLHLLRTLRNPDVGVRAVEGQLEEYLSMSLPPLDHEVTKRLAIQFQDLESIRESMRHLSVAHEALSEFLLTYRQYAARVTRERADAVFAARTSLSAHLEAAEGRARDIAEERTTRDAAHDALKELQALTKALEAEVRELSGSPSTAISVPGGRSWTRSANRLPRPSARRPPVAPQKTWQSRLCGRPFNMSGRARGLRTGPPLPPRRALARPAWPRHCFPRRLPTLRRS